MTSQKLLLSLGLLVMLSAITYFAYEQPLSSIDHTFTSDFLSFLNSGAYAQYKFDRTDITWSSYGGYQTRPTEAPSKYPVIFIHGNSDIGVGNGGYVGWQTGWTTLINYLQDSHGYSKEDLYVTTWGSGNTAYATMNNHRQEFVMYVRKFIEAVIEYTHAEKVYIVAHSMGVTLARGAVIGGQSKDSATVTYDIGEALTDKVAAFFALAGANYGLVDCTYATALATCSTTNGFSPSSEYLTRLNNNQHKEGLAVYSYWSPADDIIKYSCLVNGKNTCIVPGSDQSYSYSGFTHFNVRDNTGADIVKYMTNE